MAGFDVSTEASTCAFTVTEIDAYPPQSQDAFRRALHETAQYLATRASWFDLNLSLPPENSDLRCNSSAGAAGEN